MTNRIRYALLFLVLFCCVSARAGGASGATKHLKLGATKHAKHLTKHAHKHVSKHVSRATAIAREQLKLVKYARHYLGVRYVYGGTSPRYGFDCSGFTRFVYSHFGISLPHYSGAQYDRGHRVSRGNLRPGDLLFFDGLGHVGIYIGKRAVHPRSAHGHDRHDQPARRLVQRHLRRRPEAHLASVGMPLLLVDLDDTLIDRRGSFRNWAHDFCERYGLGDQVAWLVELDRFGYTPRDELLTQVRDRFSLDRSVSELVAAYRRDYPTYALPPSAEAIALLRRLREVGWRIGVVTNGHPTQSRKLEAAGIAELVDTCCVSETEGIRKPDPAIFELAAERCGEPLAGAWMAGDNPDADIRGAHELGLRTIWFRHGRAWEATDFEPTLTVDTLEEALAHLTHVP